MNDPIAFLKSAMQALPSDPSETTEDHLDTIVAINRGLQLHAARIIAEMGEAHDPSRLIRLRTEGSLCDLAHLSLTKYAGRAAEVHGLTLDGLMAGRRSET